MNIEKINQLSKVIFHKYLTADKNTPRYVLLKLANDRINAIIGNYSDYGLDPLFHAQYDRFEVGRMNTEEYITMQKRNKHLYCFK